MYSRSYYRHRYRRSEPSRTLPIICWFLGGVLGLAIGWLISFRMLNYDFTNLVPGTFDQALRQFLDSLP